MKIVIHGKVDNRAIRGVWVGINRDNERSHRVAPIEIDGKEWRVKPTLHQAQVKVMRGVFPLRGDTTGYEEAADIKEMNIEEEQAETKDHAKYDVKAILNHIKHEDGMEFKVSFEVGAAKAPDYWWIMEDELNGCKKIIEEYWKRRAIQSEGEDFENRDDLEDVDPEGPTEEAQESGQDESMGMEQDDSKGEDADSGD